MRELYEKVIDIFQKNPPPGHDYKHALRTAALAKKIAIAEGYDPAEAEVAGLLHDLGRTLQKSHEGHGPAGIPLAKELLDTYTQFSDDAKERILAAIRDHSNRETEAELTHILQDADKLDGMGAIGVARAYLSHYFLPDYDPDNIFPDPGVYNKFSTVQQLIRFELTWYDMLYTETAKQLGKEKYAFTKAFLEQIKKEAEEAKS